MEIPRQGESSRLRERRMQRGLTQQEVAEGLERLAWVQANRRVGVNADMVSKWERGRKAPSRFYLRLLCSLFNVTADELGHGSSAAVVSAPASHPAMPAGGAPDVLRMYDVLDGVQAPVELLQPKMLELWRDDLLSRRQVLRLMGIAPAVGGLDAIETTLSLIPRGTGAEYRGAQTLAELEVLTSHLEALYHSSDPRRLLLPVRALIGTAEDLLPVARGQQARRSLLMIVGRGHLLAGRLNLFDLHESLIARAHLDLAREAATEAADVALTAVAFGHMAFLPGDKRNFSAAAAYMAAARAAMAERPVPILSSWLSAVEAELHTKAGATAQALGSLARAREDLGAAARAPAPHWFDFYNERRLNGFEGFTLRRAGDVASAREHLEAALSANPQATPKQRSVSMVDLAVTCVEEGDLDEGCRLATEAAGDLHRAGYATAVDRLREFQGALPDPRHPAATLLGETIAELS